MIIVYVVLALLAVLFVAGACLLNYTCVRKPVDDMWDRALLEKHGFGELWDGIRGGRDWLEKQQRIPLEAVSYDGKLLRGFLVPCENARATVILFHGWRSTWKLDFGSVFEYYSSLGLNLIAVDQRAHGQSEGRFITFGVKERQDVLTWVTYAAQLLGDKTPIFIEGVSMGASSVLMAADLDFPADVRGIIADCGFISPYAIMESVIERKYPRVPKRAALWLMDVFTRLFAGFSLRGYSTLRSLEHSKYPVLLVHGTADDFVPCSMSLRNYDACAAEKELVLVEGADHAMSIIVDPLKVKAALEGFLDKYI